MSINDATNNFGDITHEGKTIHLTNEAVESNFGTEGGSRFYAAGVDDNGAEYRIAWDTTEAWDKKIADGYEPCGDYEESCDWGNPVEVREV